MMLLLVLLLTILREPGAEATGMFMAYYHFAWVQFHLVLLHKIIFYNKHGKIPKLFIKVNQCNLKYAFAFVLF